MKINSCTVIHVHVLACMEAIKARGMAKTLWKHGRLFSVAVSSDQYCYQADGLLKFKFSSLCYCPCRSDLVTKWLSDVVLCELNIEITF